MMGTVVDSSQQPPVSYDVPDDQVAATLAKIEADRVAREQADLLAYVKAQTDAAAQAQAEAQDAQVRADKQQKIVARALQVADKDPNVKVLLQLLGYLPPDPS